MLTKEELSKALVVARLQGKCVLFAKSPDLLAIAYNSLNDEKTPLLVFYKWDDESKRYLEASCRNRIVDNQIPPQKLI